MCLLFPSQNISLGRRAEDFGTQSGIAMVVSLILLLVITLMGLAVAYVSSVQSELASAITNKPLSLEAAETCFDNAIEWLSTTNGKNWVNGPGLPNELVNSVGGLSRLTVLSDTIPLNISDSRTKEAIDRIGLSNFSSCIVEKISTSTNGNTGNEIGTSNGYGDSSFVYTIKITAVGNYNIPTVGITNWQSNSSHSILEAVVEYVP